MLLPKFCFVHMGAPGFRAAKQNQAIPLINGYTFSFSANNAANNGVNLRIKKIISANNAEIKWLFSAKGNSIKSTKEYSRASSWAK